MIARDKNERILPNMGENFVIDLSNSNVGHARKEKMIISIINRSLLIRIAGIKYLMYCK